MATETVKKTVEYNEAGFEELVVGSSVTEAKFVVTKANGEQVTILLVPYTTPRKGSLETLKGDNIFMNGRAVIPGVGPVMFTGNLTPVGSKDHYGIPKKKKK